MAILESRMRSADLAELNLEQARLQAQPQAHPYVELQVQEKRNLNALKVKQLSDLTTLKVYLCISLCVYLARSLARLSLCRNISQALSSLDVLSRSCVIFCVTRSHCAQTLMQVEGCKGLRKHHRGNSPTASLSWRRASNYFTLLGLSGVMTCSI